MQKIMFNDRYGLTDAVIEGRKTMTRRLIPQLVRIPYQLTGSTGGGCMPGK